MGTAGIVQRLDHLRRDQRAHLCPGARLRDQLHLDHGFERRGGLGALRCRVRTSTKLLTDACNECGTWSTSFVDITAYRGQSIKLRFRVGAGYAAVGIDTVDVQEVFAGYETTGSPVRKVDGGDGYAELKGSLTSSAFTVEDATQFLSLDVKKVSSSASWELLVATGPSFSTYTRIGFGSAQSDWTLTRSPASGYVGEQVKVRVRPMTGTIAVDDIGLMRVQVPEWPVVDDTTRMLADGGNHYLRYHGSITSDEIEIPPGTENLVLRARDDDATYAVQAKVRVLTGAGYSTVNERSPSYSSRWLFSSPSPSTGLDQVRLGTNHLLKTLLTPMRTIQKRTLSRPARHFLIRACSQVVSTSMMSPRQVNSSIVSMVAAAQSGALLGLRLTLDLFSIRRAL
jgi:hypothetical protein